MGSELVLEKWPVLGRHERAAEWLGVWADLGRAPRTIDAYSRGLAEYLEVCERESIDPVTANRAHVAVYVRELTSRPSKRGANVVSIDSGAGLVRVLIRPPGRGVIHDGMAVAGVVSGAAVGLPRAAR